MHSIVSSLIQHPSADGSGPSRQHTLGFLPWLLGIPQGMHGGTGSRRKTSSGAPMRHDAADPAPTLSRLHRGCGGGGEECPKVWTNAVFYCCPAYWLIKSTPPQRLCPAMHSRWRQHVHSDRLQMCSHAVLCCAPMDHSVKGAASCCPSTSVNCLRTVARRARPSASASARPAAAAASADSAVSPRRRRDRRVGSRLAGSGWGGTAGGWVQGK